MTAEQYQNFQKAQVALADFSDSIEPIETERGNELFQRLADAVFEFYQKHDVCRVIQ